MVVLIFYVKTYLDLDCHVPPTVIFTLAFIAEFGCPEQKQSSSRVYNGECDRHAILVGMGVYAVEVIFTFITLKFVEIIIN